MYIRQILLITLGVALSRKEHKRELAGSLPLFWAPEATFVPIQTTSLGPNAEKFDGPALREKAQAWAENNFALAPGDSIKITNANFDERHGIYHCSMVKVSQGLEIVNSFAQITMSDDGQVISQGNSWVKTDNRASLVKRGEGVSCVDGLKTYANSMKLSANADSWTTTNEGNKTIIGNVDWTAADITCVEKLYQTANDLRHVLDMIIPRSLQYLNVMVDKATGNILGASDLSSNFRFTSNGRLVKRQVGQEFKYRVLQLGAIDPKTVKPSVIINPQDLNASPKGWHSGTSETIGNNVIATENSAGAVRVSTIAKNGKQAKADGFNFDFSFDDEKQDPRSYADASISNLFFVVNRLHDILYGYGFDEKSGNFQTDNFGKGGLGNDAVIAIAQDGGGTNNANFASPPDGSPGIMRMFLFDRTQPNRDGALENAIVIHEFVHGLTNRLTGGAANANCLSQIEGGGMGEGWSDMYAMALEMESIDTRTTVKTVGQYATNNVRSGVRKNPYSTDLNINPTTFADGIRTKQVHNVGEIWAGMLFEVYWNMVDQFGFDKDFRRNPAGKAGNNRFLSVMTTGLKLQNCFPTFVNARDAIIKADQQLFNGESECQIISGFAKRGLGLNAGALGTANDFTIPAKCQKGA